MDHQQEEQQQEEFIYIEHPSNPGCYVKTTKALYRKVTDENTKTVSFILIDPKNNAIKAAKKSAKKDSKDL